MGTISNLVKDDAISGNIFSQRLWIEDEIKEFLDENCQSCNHSSSTMEFMDFLGLIVKFKFGENQISFCLERMSGFILFQLLEFSNRFDVLGSIYEPDSEGIMQPSNFLTMWNESQNKRGREGLNFTQFCKAQVIFNRTAKQIVINTLLTFEHQK